MKERQTRERTLHGQEHKTMCMHMARMRESQDSDRFLQVQSHTLLHRVFGTSVPFIRVSVPQAPNVHHVGACMSPHIPHSGTKGGHWGQRS